MINLDFNPFPTVEKKRIYNVVGNRRTAIKRSIIGEIESQDKSARAEGGFDIETIDVNSQL